MEAYIFTGVLVIVALWLSWVGGYGFTRGSLALLFRIGWILPIVLAFFPKTRVENLPKTIALKPVHLLVDDSLSVEKNATFKGHIAKVENSLQEECLRLGCLVKKTKLSELSEETKKGYSPLSRVVEPWLYGTAGEPWVLVSDGGDYRPAQKWSPKMKDMGLDAGGKKRGFIVGYQPDHYGNVWLERGEGPIFSFVDKPIDLAVTVRRDRESLDREVVQLQVLSDDTVLSTINGTFAEKEKAIDIRIPMQALPKGQHLLTVKILPTADEASLWDNEVHASVEVLPNTIGVLHLLGAPSFGGRFLRRSLKAEPKFDLISFFILRDPGDLQLVNERELSLIPFPVDRLFNEELPNFHIVILQNFALYQFLEPSYQKNLVEFVKNGGGLLFMGGPRALKPGDANNSSLSSILPFTAGSPSKSGLLQNSLERFVGSSVDKNGPYYDPHASFTILPANPSKKQRDLADVFNEWQRLMPQLSSKEGLKGLHHMENVTFKKDEYTPLLLAKTADGKEVPLGVASYPGKGRALWLFTDSLYKVGLDPGVTSSRTLYQDFINSSLTWLLRQEIKKPLIIRSFSVDNTGGGIRFDLNLVGAAGAYLGAEGEWQVSVCGKQVDLSLASLEKVGFENWSLSGFLEIPVAGGVRCAAKITGLHPAFGSLSTQTAAIVPDTFRDQENDSSPQKLHQLSLLTGAELFFAGQGEEKLMAFLDGVTGRYGVSFPNRFRMVQDHYWILDSPLFYLLLLCLPLEVVVRRWSQLTSIRRRKRKVLGESL